MELKGNWVLWGPTWVEGPILPGQIASRVFAMTGEPLAEVKTLREGVVMLHTASRWVMAEQVGQDIPKTRKGMKKGEIG